MSNEIIRDWLRDGRPALIAGRRMRPCEHPMFAGTPMLVQRGQGTAVFLESDDGQQWLIKKFLSGRQPDRNYLHGVCHVLPAHPAFRSGSVRIVLQADSIQSCRGCFHKDLLRGWIHDSLLIPRQVGMDWAAVADNIRNGDVRWDAGLRIQLCRQLAAMTQLLESADCSHRDFSCGNVFIDPTSWILALIDFDSLFHSSLTMPNGTTVGSDGYTAPFTWNHHGPVACRSWCEHADRFALSILCAEFLIMDVGAPLCVDGGLFAQEDLCRQRGVTIDRALDRLTPQFTGADRLLNAAIHSRRFEDCPAPAEWIRYCDAFAVGSALDATPTSSITNIRAILQRRMRPAMFPVAAVVSPSVSDSPRKFGWSKLYRS